MDYFSYALSGFMCGGFINILLNDLFYKENSKTYHIESVFNLKLEHWLNYGSLFGCLSGVLFVLNNKQPLLQF